MNKEDRYEALDGLRAISCVGIVLMHILVNGDYKVHGFIFNQFIPSLTNLVFLFMAISAFGMCCGYYDKMLNREIDISSFYVKRYKKVFPFFALLCLIDLSLSPSLEALYDTFANLTLFFGFIPNANIKVIGVGWFLGTVFAFYLLFPFFCFLLEKRSRAWFAFIVSFCMSVLCGNYFNADRKSIAYSFVYFMIGGMVYIYRKELLGNKIVRYLVIIGVTMTIACYYLLSHNTFIMVLINAFLLIFAIQLSGTNILNNIVTKRLGAISFEIYLCHMVIYRVVEKAHLLHITGNEYVNYLLAFCFVFVGACIFASLGKIGVNKFIDFVCKKEISK